MKFRVAWGVRSFGLDQPLTGDCPHCGDSVGRLVRHHARRGGTQVRLSCASCCARLGNALPHSEHPRLGIRFGAKISAQSRRRKRSRRSSSRQRRSR
jgi:hypothetical protein